MRPLSSAAPPLHLHHSPLLQEDERLVTARRPVQRALHRARVGAVVLSIPRAVAPRLGQTAHRQRRDERLRAATTAPTAPAAAAHIRPAMEGGEGYHGNGAVLNLHAARVEWREILTSYKIRIRFLKIQQAMNHKLK